MLGHDVDFCYEAKPVEGEFKVEPFVYSPDDFSFFDEAKVKEDGTILVMDYDDEVWEADALNFAKELARHVKKGEFYLRFVDVKGRIPFALHVQEDAVVFYEEADNGLLSPVEYYLEKGLDLYIKDLEEMVFALEEEIRDIREALPRLYAFQKEKREPQKQKKAITGCKV